MFFVVCSVGYGANGAPNPPYIDYTAFERKLIVLEIREQLAHQPNAETKNRKPLRENPIASWELRVGKHRIFYEVDETARDGRHCVRRAQRAQCSLGPRQRGPILA